jgi:transcriptional regulator with XRE-family HTH domain
MKRGTVKIRNEAMITLKRHRLMKGLSGKQVAKRIHVSKAAYSSWETGRQCPRPDRLSGLARVLGISTEELIDLFYPCDQPRTAA